jgi:hypothetical protein
MSVENAERYHKPFDITGACVRVAHWLKAITAIVTETK